MDNKKKTYLIIGGIAAVVLVSVVLVGLINGVWPWQTGKDFGDGYIGSNLSGDKETTESTDGTTEPETTNKEEENKGTENTEPNKPSDNDNDNDFDIDIDTGTGDENDNQDNNNGGGQGNNQDNGQGNNQQGDGQQGGDQGDGNQEDEEDKPNGNPSVGGTTIDFDDLLNMSGK